VLHRRRVLADDRRLARRRSHAHPDGPRCDRDGALGPRHHHADLRCHSDAGSQFTSIRYGERLAEIGATPSIGTVGDSFDNALAETVNGYYKTELIRGPARTGPWKTIEEVELATLGWVHWHNHQRLHGYLNDLPPAEFEALHASHSRLQTPDPGDLPVAEPTRRAADRLPERQLEPVNAQNGSTLSARPTRP
jgi:transposase InsO family protein